MGNNQHFGNELEIFRGLYNNFMQKETTSDAEKILPSNKNNNVFVDVVIQLVIILIIPFFSFIIYKETYN